MNLLSHNSADCKSKQGPATALTSPVSLDMQMALSLVSSIGLTSMCLCHNHSYKNTSHISLIPTTIPYFNQIISI